MFMNVMLGAFLAATLYIFPPHFTNSSCFPHSPSSFPSHFVYARLPLAKTPTSEIHSTLSFGTDFLIFAAIVTLNSMLLSNFFINSPTTMSVLPLGDHNKLISPHRDYLVGLHHFSAVKSSLSLDYSNKDASKAIKESI